MGVGGSRLWPLPAASACRGLRRPSVPGTDRGPRPETVGTRAGRPRQLGEHFLSEPRLLPPRLGRESAASCPGTGSRSFWAQHPGPPPASRLPVQLPRKVLYFLAILAPGAAPAAPYILRRPPPPDQEAEQSHRPGVESPSSKGPPPPSLWERKQAREGRAPQQGGQSRAGGERVHDHLPCSAVRWSVIQSTHGSRGRGEVGAGVQTGPQSRGVSTTPLRPWRTRATTAAACPASTHGPSSSRGHPRPSWVRPVPSDRTQAGERPLQRVVGIPPRWGREPGKGWAAGG